MCPCVSFEIKCIVETFATECTQVPFHLTMTFQMTVKKPLKMEGLATNTAGKLVRLRHCWKYNNDNIKKYNILKRESFHHGY